MSPLIRAVLLSIIAAASSACATTANNSAMPSATAAAVATPASASADTKAATVTYPTDERPLPPCSAHEAAFDCDRRAILSMVGEFEVTFNFKETVILAPGYRRREPQPSRGFEFVELIEDAGTRIELQHILVAPSGHVTKHWRQAWRFEAPSHWSYVGSQRFERMTRPAEAVSGTWTQLVYEVSDAPRYAGSGRFNHRYGVPTWTSERTWRPLPRREYTKRDDYDLINAENRHTITPAGWTHEQDNTKVIRRNGSGDRTLVREFGFNDYRRISGYDFSKGRAFWQRTAPFWSLVRAKWDVALADPAGVTLAFPSGDEKLIEGIFTLAAEVDGGRDPETTRDDVALLIDGAIAERAIASDAR